MSNIFVGIVTLLAVVQIISAENKTEENVFQESTNNLRVDDPYLEQEESGKYVNNGRIMVNGTIYFEKNNKEYKIEYAIHEKGYSIKKYIIKDKLQDSTSQPESNSQAIEPNTKDDSEQGNNEDNEQPEKDNGHTIHISDIFNDAKPGFIPALSEKGHPRFSFGSANALPPDSSSPGSPVSGLSGSIGTSSGYGQFGKPNDDNSQFLPGSQLWSDSFGAGKTGSQRNYPGSSFGDFGYPGSSGFGQSGTYSSGYPSSSVQQNYQQTPTDSFGPTYYERPNSGYPAPLPGSYSQPPVDRYGPSYTSSRGYPQYPYTASPSYNPTFGNSQTPDRYPNPSYRPDYSQGRYYPGQYPYRTSDTQNCGTPCPQGYIRSQQGHCTYYPPKGYEYPPGSKYSTTQTPISDLGYRGGASYSSGVPPAPVPLEILNAFLSR